MSNDGGDFASCIQRETATSTGCYWTFWMFPKTQQEHLYVLFHWWHKVKVLKPMWSLCDEIWKMWFRNGCQVDFSITYREAPHRRNVLCSVPVLLLWLRYTLDEWGIEVWLPAGAQVLLFSTVSRPVLEPTQPQMDTGDCFPMAKLLWA